MGGIQAGQVGIKDIGKQPVWSLCEGEEDEAEETNHNPSLKDQDNRLTTPWRSQLGG
jgi:hypothetical protein